VTRSVSGSSSGTDSADDVLLHSAAVLDAYNDRVVRGRIERHLADAVAPLTGLTAFFVSTYEQRPSPDPGCLLTNTAIEAPTLSEGARGAVAGGMEAIRGAFEDVLSRAREEGQIPADAEVGVLAQRLLALYQGLLVLVRLGRPLHDLAVIPGAIPAIVGHTETRGVHMSKRRLWEQYAACWSQPSERGAQPLAGASARMLSTAIPACSSAAPSS